MFRIQSLALLGFVACSPSPDQVDEQFTHDTLTIHNRDVGVGGQPNGILEEPETVQSQLIVSPGKEVPLGPPNARGRYTYMACLLDEVRPGLYEFAWSRFTGEQVCAEFSGSAHFDDDGELVLGTATCSGDWCFPNIGGGGGVLSCGWVLAGDGIAFSMTTPSGRDFEFEVEDASSDLLPMDW